MAITPETVDVPLQPRRWPRISLRAWLATIVIVTLVISNFVIARRLREAETSLARIRKETGLYAVDDPSRAQVSLIESKPNRWKWRVWLPEGSQYLIHQMMSEIPLQGLGVNRVGTPLSAGPHWIVARYYRDSSGYRQFAIRIDSESPLTIAGPSTTNHPAGLEGGSTWTADVKGLGSPASVPFRKPLELLRYRQGELIGNGVLPSKSPTFGVLLWIEPIP